MGDPLYEFCSNGFRLGCQPSEPDPEPKPTTQQPCLQRMALGHSFKGLALNSVLTISLVNPGAILVMILTSCSKAPSLLQGPSILQPNDVPENYGRVHVARGFRLQGFALGIFAFSG